MTHVYVDEAEEFNSFSPCLEFLVEKFLFLWYNLSRLIIQNFSGLGLSPGHVIYLI